jgi:creatinine amidohydrolase/Fe(II)-dependent formamide hydrolase-like protein
VKRGTRCDCMRTDSVRVGNRMRNIIRLDKMTRVDVAELLACTDKKPGILLPVGCTEQHGSHLPLGCDTAIARGAAEHLALGLLTHPKYRAVVIPDVAYTPSPGVEFTMGTISVEFDLLGDLLKQALAAAFRSPWAFAAIVNGHAHNHGRVIEASMTASSGKWGRKVPVVILNIYEFVGLCEQVGLNPGSHAGEFEMALYCYYEKVGEMNDDCESPPKPMRDRPSHIYGLEVMARSRNGVIASSWPNYNKAFRVSSELGKSVDRAIRETLTENLNVYFAQWARHDEIGYI